MTRMLSPRRDARMIHAAAPAADPRNIRAVATIQAVGNAKAGEPVRFRGVAYTGGMLRVAGFESGVVIDLAGLQIPGSLPIATDHRSDLDARLGSATARVEDGALVIEGTIVPGTPSADRAIALMRAGGLSLSIGARPVKLERLRDGATINGQSFAGRPEVATESELVEVSAVGVGADRGATAIAAGATPTGGGADPVIAERERVKGIRAAFRGIDSPEAQAECDRLIESGESVVEGEKTALKMLRASRPNVNGVRGSGGVTDANTLGASAAHLLGASGAAIAAAKLPAPPERGPRSLMDLAAEALRIEGREVPVSADKMVRAAFSTDTFSGTLATALSVVGLEGFNSAEEPAMMVAHREPLPNFKPATLARLNGNFVFRPLGQDGELKSSDIDGDTTPIRLITKGAIARLTREAVINDDRQLLAGVPRELGREAARSIGDAMAEALDDAGGDFFTEARGNLLTGSESALSVDGLTFAIQDMRTMKDNSGRVVNLAPRFLLVGADMEARARSIVNSTELGMSDGSPRGNPMANIAEVLVDARIPALTWYLISAPQNAAIVLATLNGMVSPNVEALPPEANTLGIGWRAWLDYGIALHEWRGIIKNTGE